MENKSAVLITSGNTPIYAMIDPTIKDLLDSYSGFDLHSRFQTALENSEQRTNGARGNSSLVIEKDKANKYYILKILGTSV